MDEISAGPLDRRVGDLLNRRPVTAILATVDEAGSPWTTPVNCITCIQGNAVIRMALERNSTALANLEKNDHIMIAILDEGDIAVGIAGHARVVKRTMNTNPLMALVEVDVCGVKDDTWPELVVCQGIRTRPRRELVTFLLRRTFMELRS